MSDFGGEPHHPGPEGAVRRGANTTGEGPPEPYAFPGVPRSGRDGSAECWLRLNGGLLAGIHHSLNNRLASLSAVGQILETDMPRGHALCELLGRELALMEAVVATLSLLGDSDERPQPVEAEWAMRQAADLFVLHPALRDLPLEVITQEHLHPIWIPPATLVRGLLILLAAAARTATPGGGAITLSATGDRAMVSFVIGVPPGDEANGESDEEDAGAVPLRGIRPEAAGMLIGPHGGEVLRLRAEAGIRYLLRLPTLSETRRRFPGR